YHPDYDFLRSMGIELSEQQCRPVCDPVSLESNVHGIYVAGVVVGGAAPHHRLPLDRCGPGPTSTARRRAQGGLSLVLSVARRCAADCCCAERVFTICPFCDAPSSMTKI